MRCTESNPVTVISCSRRLISSSSQKDVNTGGAAYLADRGTPGNPSPGSDSLLRLPTQALADAAVPASDLLVATGGVGLTVAVRCADTCTRFRVADGPAGGPIEAHIVFGAG